MWVLILIGLVSAVFLYLKVAKALKFWEEKGVDCVKPWPFLGNMESVFFRTKPFGPFLQDLYKAFPEKRYMGVYLFLKPGLMIRDPELIKQITVKEFDTFPEHPRLAPEDVDPLWNNNLFAMKGGDRWHDMRSTLSPSFTSSKMRMVFGLMKDCARQFSAHFQQQGGTTIVEMKDVFAKVSTDIIGTTAFGITCDSLKDQKNEFFTMGKEVTDLSGLRGFVFFLYAISPTLMKFLNVSIIPVKMRKFFTGIIDESLRVRRDQGVVRPDMIHLLMEAQKGRLKHEEQTKTTDTGFAVVEESELGKFQKRSKIEITDQDITAQAVVFFLAGFNTTSTLMSYVSYELALNPSIQKRLRDEVDAAMLKGNGNITYEALLEMKYLDMVISETLRLWPPSEMSDRISVKDFTIEPKLPGEKPLHLVAGTTVWIPIYPMHRDPQYYPNPNKFDPERFSDENKQKIKQCTFLPFGVGPRSCIGSRFALLQAKLIMFEILSKFELVVVEKTQVPLVLLKGTFGLMTQKGIWLGLKPRNYV